MKKTHFILLTSVAILFFSCWHPPFDPLVSASELTTDKMGSPVWRATVRIRDDAAGGYYLPGRDPAYYGNGVWIIKGTDFIRAGLFSPSSQSGFSLPFAVKNDFGKSSVILSLLLNPTPTVAKILIGANSQTDYGLVTFNGSHSPVFTPSFIPDVIGFGVAPFDINNDFLALLTWPAPSPYPSIGCQIINGNSSPLSLTFQALSLAPPPRPTGPVFVAYYQGSSYLYASYPVNGNNVTYRWNYNGIITPVTPPVFIPLQRKLTGILSDGRLLSDSGDRLYVYSADGGELFSILTGPIRFVHERTDGSVWYSVFTRTIRIPPNKNGDEAAHLLEIYEIKTSDLSGLAK